MRTRRLAVLAFALVGALSAAPTRSARVVAVRVGDHPTYTRVVFELDGRAGYRIERREEAGGAELVVTLDAASEPRDVRSRGPLVAGVSVESDDQGAVARVKLRRAVPLVKEMLLANPSRIVLDLVLPDELAARRGAKPAEAPAATPAPVEKPALAEAPAPSEKPALAEAPAVAPRPAAEAKPTPAPAPAAKPPVVAAKPSPPAEPTKPVEVASPPAPVAPPTKPVEQAKAPEPAKPAPRGAAAEGAKPPAPVAVVDGAEAPAAAEAPAPVAPSPPAIATPDAAKPARVAKAPESPAKSTVPAPPPRAAAPKGPVPRWSSSDPIVTIGIVAGAALLFALVVVRVMRRRRAKPTPLDVLESAREAGATPLADEDDGAFGGFERTTAEADAGHAPERRPSYEPEPTYAPAPPTSAPLPVAGPGLFDEDAEKETEMEMGAGLSIEREPLARPAPMATGMGASSDLDALVRQLEKRLAQLETRLDEANAARERLERQVAAQSEELRVQRAAIARTQRALRGMTRGGDEQATEPALRDPSKPSTGRP